MEKMIKNEANPLQVSKGLNTGPVTHGPPSSEETPSGKPKTDRGPARVVTGPPPGGPIAVSNTPLQSSTPWDPTAPHRGMAESASNLPPQVSIPIGRGSELRQEIKNYQSRWNEEQRQLDVLKLQITQKGGERNADPHKVIEKEDREVEVERLRLIVNALKDEQNLQSRYETEIGVFAPLRMQLALAQGRDPGNVNVLALAEKIYPNIFSKESVLLGLSPSHLAKKFEDVTTIDNEIERLKQVVFVSEQTQLLQFRLGKLIEAKKAKTTIFEQGNPPPPSLVDKPDIDLPRLSDNSPFYDIVLGEGWYQRIYLINLPSAAPIEQTNWLVLYEVYPPNTTDRVHLALTYYQTWHSGQFSLSDNPDLYDTLRQFETQLCSDICRKRECEETSYYRLPNCILFLRFYDETELVEHRLEADRLLHIPFCYALDPKTWSKTPDHKNVLDENNSLLKTHSIPDWLFVELFNRKMLGSVWIDKQSLQHIYSVLRENPPKEVNSIMHSQIYKRN